MKCACNLKVKFQAFSQDIVCFDEKLVSMLMVEKLHNEATLSLNSSIAL